MKLILIPKIKFTYSQKFDVDYITRFVSPKKGDWNWSEKIFYFHPRLKKELKNVKDIKKRRKIVRDYVKDWFNKKENILRLEKKKREIEDEWIKIHGKFIKNLLKILDLTKHNVNEITCLVSINPINPRELDTNLFSVFYNYEIDFIKVIIAHEITHFFYFEKWMQVFSDSDSKTFEGPHVIWHLSEIMAPIILANPKVQSILNKLDTGYEEHGRIKIGDKNIIEHFDILYKNFDKNKDFGEFLKKAYEEIKKYKKELDQV